MQAITSDRTFLPIGLTVALLVTAVGGTWALSGYASRITVLEVRQNAILETQRELVGEMKEANKTLAEILATLPKSQHNRTNRGN